MEIYSAAFHLVYSNEDFLRKPNTVAIGDTITLMNLKWIAHECVKKRKHKTHKKGFIYL